ncbi:MAG: MFS transporter [Verrucomicrobia bacterium]|nr:MFS transporter [Verrucomicrobiota bacterium]
MHPTPSAPAPRNYPLLLTGQFLGAFGDNFLLAAILGPLTYAINTGRITEAKVNGENALFGLVFTLPFIVLAPLAGYLNDRMSKTLWLTGGNVLKLLGTFTGLAAVYAYPGDASHTLQVIGYTIVGFGACIYSPAKYGILPEILPRERLVKANGTVEMLTLVAIVGGLAGGGILYDNTLSLPLCYTVSAGLYLAALVCNAAMTRTPGNTSAHFGRSVREFAATFVAIVRSPRLGRILLGSALFWFAGSTLKTALQGWGLMVYTEAGVTNVTNLKLVLLKLGLVAGIVAGSVLAGQLHKIGDLSWARRYGTFMAAGFLGLGLLGGHHGLTLVVLVLILTGAAAGLLIVPVNAALQSESDPTTVGKTVAIQNFADCIGIAVGAAFLGFLTKQGLNPHQSLMVLGGIVAAITLALRVVGFDQRKA